MFTNWKDGEKACNDAKEHFDGKKSALRFSCVGVSCCRGILLTERETRTVLFKLPQRLLESRYFS